MRVVALVAASRRVLISEVDRRDGIMTKPSLWRQFRYGELSLSMAFVDFPFNYPCIICLREWFNMYKFRKILEGENICVGSIDELPHQTLSLPYHMRFDTYRTPDATQLLE